MALNAGNAQHRAQLQLIFTNYTGGELNRLHSRTC
jgi:hypothetical protein